MMFKQYEKYLTKLYLKNIFIILVVFIFLSFFLNIFEEIKYFENKKIRTLLSNNFNYIKYSIYYF